MMRFFVIDELFNRYTVFMDLGKNTTHIWCEECEQWVADYDDEEVSKHTENEFYELIVREHEKQILGERIVFEDSPEDLSGWSK